MKSEKAMTGTLIGRCTLRAVYVLHAFQKKSKWGIETPKPDVDLIERRLRTVLDRYRTRDRS